MTPFQQLWTDRASRLGLSVAIPFALSLDGMTLTIPVLLRQFGVQNGMLLATDFGLISPHAERLVEMGYGFSTLSEPKQPQPKNDEVLFEMLRDWGWSGEGPPPFWMHGGAG